MYALLLLPSIFYRTATEKRRVKEKPKKLTGNSVLDGVPWPEEDVKPNKAALDKAMAVLPAASNDTARTLVSYFWFFPSEGLILF